MQKRLLELSREPLAGILPKLEEQDVMFTLMLLSCSIWTEMLLSWGLTDFRVPTALSRAIWGKIRSWFLEERPCYCSLKHLFMRLGPQVAVFREESLQQLMDVVRAMCKQFRAFGQLQIICTRNCAGRKRLVLAIIFSRIDYLLRGTQKARSPKTLHLRSCLRLK